MEGYMLAAAGLDIHCVLALADELQCFLSITLLDVDHDMVLDLNLPQ